MKTKLDRLRKKGDKLDKKVAKKQAKGKGKAQMKKIVKSLKNEDKQRKEISKVNKKAKKKVVKGLEKAVDSPAKFNPFVHLTKNSKKNELFVGEMGGKKNSPAKMMDKKKPGKRKDKYTAEDGTKVKVKIKRYKTKSGRKQATVKVKTKTTEGQKKKKVMSTGDRKFREDGSIRMNNPQGYSSRKKAKKGSPVKMTGKAYDNKEAYNKNLSASARLHYLENERSDDKSPMNMHGKKSPLEKELVGKQNNLPAGLKAKIEASPAKMYGKKQSPMNMSRELSYGGPVIDQEPKALSHMGASKVLRHMKGGSHSPLNMNAPGKPKEKSMKGDTVRGFSNYNVGDMVSEDDFESKFKNKGNNSKNYPQLSVQDYSNVKEDKKGKYVVKRKD